MSVLRDLNRAYPTGGRIAEIPYAGIRGDLVPTDGVIYNDITLPADDAVLFRSEFLTAPASGTFTAHQDGSTSLVGAADGVWTADYQLYRDGVADGGVQTATFTVGGGATLYAVMYQSALGNPSAAQVKAGQDVTSSAAVWADSVTAPTITGVYDWLSTSTGGSASTNYKFALVWSDGTSDSAVVVSDAWVTLAGTVTLDANIGAATAEGFTALLGSQQILNGAVGSATAEGLQALLGSQQILPGAVGAATAEGLTAELTVTESGLTYIDDYYEPGYFTGEYAGHWAYLLNGTVGESVAEGFTASFITGTTLEATVGSATAEGFSALLGVSTTLEATVGSATANGHQAQLNSHQVLNASVGSATAEGTQAGFTNTLNAVVGEATASGFTAALGAASLVLGSVGEATAEGFTALLGIQQTLNASVGEATAEGNTARLIIYLGSNPGSATAEGYSASLNITLFAGVGSAIAEGFTAEPISARYIPFPERAGISVNYTQYGAAPVYQRTGVNVSYSKLGIQ